MKKLFISLIVLVAASAVSAQTVLTIASVNNPNMEDMRDLSSIFEEANPDIALEWLFLDEGTLRSRLQTEVATGGGSFDLVTVGAYETPLWAANDWIVSIDGLAEANPDAAEGYDFDDILAPVRDMNSYNGELYAVPFYAESSFTMYNKRILDEAGFTMPDAPTWEEVAEIACAVHDPDNGVYGIALRGKPGWGDNMAPITTVANTFGAQWFDAEGRPQLDSPEWNEALTFYADLATRCGPPGLTGNSFNESRQLMENGQAAIWVDATVAAGIMASSPAGPDLSQALAPVGPVEKGNAWLWSWNLGIPSSSENQDAAFRFLTWATSKEYLELVAAEKGWAAIPPGTRASTYERQEYLDAAPFAEMTLNAILKADPTDSTANPTIAPGVQFVQIPEFSAIGTDVAQQVAAALAGDVSVEEALARSQEIADEAMQDAGYY